MHRDSQPSPGPRWEALPEPVTEEDSSQEERQWSSNVASASIRSQKTIHQQALKRKERDRPSTSSSKNKRPRHEESAGQEKQSMGRPALTSSISAPVPSGSAGSSRPSASTLSQAGPSRSSNSTFTAKPARDRYKHLSVNEEVDTGLTIEKASSPKNKSNGTRDFPTTLSSNIFARTSQSANSAPKKPVQSAKSFIGNNEVFEISSDDSDPPPPPVKQKAGPQKSKRAVPPSTPRARKSTGSAKPKPTRKPSHEVIIIEDSDDGTLEFSYPSVEPKRVRELAKEPGPSASASQTSNPQQAYEYPGSEEVQETDHEIPIASPTMPNSPMDLQADQSDHDMRTSPNPPSSVPEKQELFSPHVPAGASASTSEAVSHSTSPVIKGHGLHSIPTPPPLDSVSPQLPIHTFKTAFKSASRVSQKRLSSSPASDESRFPENNASVPASPGSLLEDEIGTLNLSDAFVKAASVAKQVTAEHPPVIVADKPTPPHPNPTSSGSASSEVVAPRKPKMYARKSTGATSLVDAINAIHNQHSAKPKRKPKVVQPEPSMGQTTDAEHISKENAELQKQREKSKMFRNALISRKGKGKEDASSTATRAPLPHPIPDGSISRTDSDELRLRSPSTAMSPSFTEGVPTLSNHHLKSSTTLLSDTDFAQRPPLLGEASSSSTKLGAPPRQPVAVSEDSSILAIAQKSPPIRKHIRPIDLQLSPERLQPSSQDNAPLKSPKSSMSTSSGAAPPSTLPSTLNSPKTSSYPSPITSPPQSPRPPKPSESRISSFRPPRLHQSSLDDLFRQTSGKQTADANPTVVVQEKTTVQKTTVGFLNNDVDMPLVPRASRSSDTSDDEAMQEVAEVEALIENEVKTHQYSDDVDESRIEPPESSSAPSISLSSSSRSSASEPWLATPDDSEAPAFIQDQSSEDTVIRKSKTYGGFQAVTMKDHISERMVSLQQCRYARDLPHIFHDYVNDMPLYMRMLPEMRKIYEAVIMENTAEDEPDAPPIEIQNEVDGEPTPPWEFYYTNEMWLGDDVPPPDTENLVRCNCKGGCNPRSKTCACLKRQQKEYGDATVDFAYDKTGKLLRPGYPIFECNDLCGCGDECRNRVVQHGRKVSVAIRKTETKGWGVFAMRKILAGTFIGIYSGELITDIVAHKRGVKYNKFGRTYLFDLDFHHLRGGKDDDDWNNSFTVDAYHAGNFTRFLNHSCDPNSRLYPCYINEGNINKPLLVIFSRRDIEANEEICFNYQGSYPDDEDDEDEDEPDGSDNMEERDLIYMNCMCGAKRCTGKMFK